MAISYTQKQSQSLIVKIDRQAQKACDEAESIFTLIPDHGLTAQSVTDEILFRASVLKDIVHRRTAVE